VKQVIKGVFDKVSAALAVIVLSPLFGLIALAIWIPDRGSVFLPADTGRQGWPAVQGLEVPDDGG